MAIAHDADSGAFIGSCGSTQTLSHTTSGSNRYLCVGVSSDQASDNCTGVTYNGVSMTRIRNAFTANSLTVTIFGLANPASGSNNIVASYTSTGQQMCLYGTSFTGATQTTSPADSGNDGSANSAALTISTTTVASNTFLFGIMRDQGGGESAGANTTMATNPQAGFASFYSTAVRTPGGAFSLVMNHNSAVATGQIVSIAQVALVNASFLLNFV